MIKDLTKGAPLKLILLFSIPLLIGNIFQQLYNLADIVIVGRTLGVKALASVGAVAPLFFLIMFAIAGMTNGFAIITGQKFGSGDVQGVRRSSAVSIILSTIVTILFSALCAILMKPILYMMNVPQDIFHDAYLYIQICVLGLITANFYNLLASILRALGDSKTPLYFLIFASILNIFLALLFILKFHMGVPGSAIAVVISQGFSVILCLLYIKKRFPILHLKKSDWVFKKENRKEDIDFIYEHLKVGFPMAMQFSILGISMLIIQSVCNTFGADIIAAFTAALRIEQIATMPMISFGVALSAFVAQNFGAKNINRIRYGVIKTSMINLTLSLIMAFVMRYWGTHIVGIFIGNDKTQVIKIAHDYLWISTIFYFFLGQIFIFRNALQGMGKPLIPLTSSFAELMIRSFAAVYLAVKFGYYGIFYSGPIAWIIASIILSIGYFINIKKIIFEKKFKLTEKSLEE